MSIHEEQLHTMQYGFDQNKEELFISGVIVSSIKCTHLWNYGNIAVKDKPHPRVRECLKCKKFEYV
tara:strand:- start:853 stop:1050 length:198 start_codon:yes stop_codon:yes gene_type:complete